MSGVLLTLCSAGAGSLVVMSELRPLLWRRCLLAAGCGVVLSASGMRRWEGAMFLADWTGDPRAWARVGGAIALVLFYIFGADYLGFVITCALILVALFLMLGVRWWLAIVIALVVTITIERSFGSLLLVPLPRGLFWV